MTAQAVTSVGFVDLGITAPDQLLALVTQSVGQDRVDRADLTIAEVPYDLHALTTRGRYRVRGQASRAEVTWPVSIFVKVVQSWSRSPAFQWVPVEMRELAMAGLPWQVEPLVYRSELGRALPPGLRMPSAYAVLDLDADSAAIWMADIDLQVGDWTYDQYSHAATLLGRFAARRRVAWALEPLRPWIGEAFIRGYVKGRVAEQVLPALRSPELWQHPLVAAHFGRLRDRLSRLAGKLPELVNELEGLPAGVGHGDACTRNLLRTADTDELVLIDFGMLRFAPLGFDLGQLVFGQVQLGERPSADVDQLWECCLAGYLRGLRLEQLDTPPDQVRRAAAISVAIFSGISAIPVEYLDQPPDDRIDTIFAARATSADFILDQVGC